MSKKIKSDYLLLEATNKDLVAALNKLSKKEEENDSIKAENISIKAEKNSIKAMLDELNQRNPSKDSLYLGFTEISSGVFEKDGIIYSTSEPTEQDLHLWREKYRELCRELIKDKIFSYSIPQDMVDEDPCVVYLVLYSESIPQQEKQSWFDLWPLMNEEQINKLYDILYRECYQLGQMSEEKKKKAQLIDEYSRRAGHQPIDDVQLGNLQAYDYANIGEYETALNIIDRTITLASKSYANVLDSKGEILLMQSDDNEEEALKIWKTIIETVPDFLDDHKNGTVLYRELKKRGKVE